MIANRRYLTITPEELDAHLAAGQGDRVAYLPAKAAGRAIAETLVAMANASGGVVLLGVGARGAPQPNLDARSLAERAAHAGLLADPPLILPSPQLVAGTRGQAVVILVPPGLPHLYSLQGAYLTRTSGKNRPLTTTELRRLLLERGDLGFESQPATGASLVHLDPVRIQRYLDQIGAAPDEDPWEMLLARGCVTPVDAAAGAEHPRLTPTVAGILLFSQEPQRFVHSAEILCVRYAGVAMTDEFVRQDITGPLAEQVRQAEAFVASNMRRGMRISGLAREESAEYPLAVVREAMVNAIAHRDYSVRGEGIRVLMFSDRMEVYSPGRLPGHVTVENIRQERYSRNEAIVAVLSDLGYIERLGYGIDRMIATMLDAGLPEPLFEETAAGFKVTLRSAGTEMVSGQPRDQRWSHTFLNERQEQALAHIQQNGRITNSEYQALVPDVSPETIRRDLADLVEKNLLIRIGEKRATYYILK